MSLSGRGAEPAPAPNSQNANAKEHDPAANAPEEPKRPPNSAAAISAIAKDLPVYPNAKVHIPGVWSSPMEMRPNTWTSSYEANTPDPMEKVLAWYEKEMKAHGWIGHPSFKGMMGFDKKSAPGKAIVLASGPDQKTKGQTLIRIFVQDE